MYPPVPLPQCCCKHCLRDDLICKNQHCTGGGGGGHKKVYELISTIVVTTYGQFTALPLRTI